MLDVLDDFNTLSTSESKKPQQPASSDPKEKEPVAAKTTPGKTEKESLDDFSMDEDEFAKQLASAMSDWMQEMDNDKETRETFEKIWSSFETEQGKGEGVGAASNSTGNNSDARPGETKSFQESISQTMNKLKESSKNIDVSH